MEIINDLKELQRLDVEIPQMEIDKEGKICGGFAAMAPVDEEAYGTNTPCSMMSNIECRSGDNSNCKSGQNISCKSQCNPKGNSGSNLSCKVGCNIDSKSQSEDKQTEQKKDIGLNAVFPSGFSLLF